MKRPRVRATSSVVFALLVALLATGCNDNTKIVSAEELRLIDSATARRENELAYELIAKGQYAKAREHLQRSLAADANYFPAHNNMGLVQLEFGELDAAAGSFETAARLEPQQGDPKNNLGLLFESIGRLELAAEYYQRALKTHPENGQYIANLARVRYKQNARDPATKKLFEDLVLRAPDEAWRDFARRYLLRLEARERQEASGDVLGPKPAATAPAPEPVRQPPGPVVAPKRSE